ncbi:MAG: FAD-binding oxidoreductase [Micrococcales bacterium]|nr:FAD-binding oxidoreductase [Micrococcales bacterium]MCL2667233.1 FAD-binding oxidoreductase [Micrococcales bacterium]
MSSSDVTSDDLVAALRQAVRGEVADDARRRAEYSTDASNYRVVPQVVVAPLDTDDLLIALAVAREAGVPVTARGAGTSVAGNAVGPGMVLDLVRHLDRIGPVDTEARTVHVEPGVIMAAVQKAAAPHGLRFGPDPSTWTRATFGGMIGNNACGPHAVAYGRTADNVVGLDVVDGTGRRFTTRAGDLSVVPGLDGLVNANLEVIRTELGRFTRQVSGYSLEHLLPENGCDLAKALVGSEGTCVVVLGATLRLVDLPAAPVLVVLGYPDMAAAADAVPPLLEHQPLAVEGMDARLVDVVRRVRGASAVPALPDGGGWLFCEISGADLAEARAAAQRFAADAGTDAVAVYEPGPQASAVWSIRADGAGLAGRTASGAQAWPGFEDSAVPPQHLGEYLRALEALMADHQVDGMAYGHFGDGCVHLRLDMDLVHDGSALRSFMTDAADLVASYGGSLSGEHGDGRARSELLPVMYSPRALEVFGGFKHLFDPDSLLNPGVLVDPRPLDADLRRPTARRLGAHGFAFAEDDHDLTTAVHRCVGVAKCRADGGFMCPSYRATNDEKDVPRGRARVLQELANGTLVSRGWSSPEVAESLDLCLSCKACSAECPAGVDIAQYKAEVTHRRLRRRLRPVNHYVLGWLPRWARAITAGRFGPLVNAVLGVRPIARLVLRAGGMDPRRDMVTFARTPFRATAHLPSSAPGPLDPARSAAPTSVDATTHPVVLWTDSFNDNLSPQIAHAMVRVLRDAGYDVLVPDDTACCGLTWVATGQLDGAKRRLRQLLDVLAPFAVNNIPIIGVEPSCTALLRSDLPHLLGDDPRAEAVARATHTLAELLTAEPPIGPGDRWNPPDLSGLRIVAQPHCHHHAVMTWSADRALLERTGADITELSGCCGLAGNFGMERGHYDISVAVAEQSLLPALRTTCDIYLADGFSCRTQAAHLAGAHGVHLAQLLTRGVRCQPSSTMGDGNR